MPTQLWAANGARFMRKVKLNMPGDCWPWAAAVHPKHNAGFFRIYEGEKKRWVLGHTASWMIFHGPPPNTKRERIITTCGNILCVNPQHLEVRKLQGMGGVRNAGITYAEKIEKKFWEHVAPSDDLDCLLYSPVRADGFAMVHMMIDGRRTAMPAHRYAMQLKHGPVPRDVVVLQRCGHKACVSYNHLYFAQPGYFSNKKKRQFEPCGQRGEKRPMAKLTADDIPRIFHWHRVRGYSTAEIAQHVGVNPTTIKHVLRRETWRHIDI